MSSVRPVLALLVLLASLSRVLTATAGTIFVDNHVGSDSFDGRAQQTLSEQSGPVRSITKGLSLVRPGDSMVIANHGIPYYESITLAGSRLSGTPFNAFAISSNGAVLDGSVEVPRGSWTKVAGNVWKLPPRRKAIYLLLRDGVPLPETPVEQGATQLPELAEGSWCGFRGSIYFRPEGANEPDDTPLSFAVHDMGLTLFNAHDVTITGLTFRHFRIDGINAHDQCRNVRLDTITSTENGRAGLTVGGTSSVIATQCDFTRNRLRSIRLDELGDVNLTDVKVDKPAPEPPQPEMP